MTNISDLFCIKSPRYLFGQMVGYNTICVESSVQFVLTIIHLNTVIFSRFGSSNKKQHSVARC